VASYEACSTCDQNVLILHSSGQLSLMARVRYVGVPQNQTDKSS
jgi:hypothetical protein